MIINHDRGFIFVHVPKTAGTSLHEFMSQFTTYKDIEVGEAPLARMAAPYYGKRFGFKKHSTSEEIKGIIGNDDFGNLFKFGFVRNPYDRAYSLYKFLRNNWRHWSGSEIMNSLRTFDEFVISDFFYTPGPDRIFEPQTFWLCRDDGSPAVDFVGRTESIDADLQRICATLRLPRPEGDLVWTNVSKSDGSMRRFRDLLRAPLRLLERAREADVAGTDRPRTTVFEDVYRDDRTKEQVAHRYRKDFLAFSYDTALPATGGLPAASGAMLLQQGSA